jgi:hypothetical protein
VFIYPTFYTSSNSSKQRVMAVLPSCPGLTVKLVVDDQILREYEDPNGRSGPRKVSKYIESATGVHFAVRVRFRPPFPTDQDVSVKISVDGRTLVYDRVASDDLNQHGGHIHEGPIVKSQGQTFRQKFRFTAVESSKFLTQSLPSKIALLTHTQPTSVLL